MKLPLLIKWAPICALLLSTMPLIAIAAHPHHEHEKNISLCSEGIVDPDIRCSKFVTTDFDLNERLWLAWYFNGHVYTQYSDDLGESLSKPVKVNKTPEKIDDSGEDRVKIAFGQQGEIYLAWTMKTPRKYTGHIRFSRSINGGQFFSNPITIDDDEFESHRFAAMQTNQNGDIYLAWLDKRDLFRAKAKKQNYVGSAVYFTRSTDQGETFLANKKIADHSCECCRVSMEIDKTGVPVILWRHVFENSMRDHAITRFDDETTSGEIIRVSEDEWSIKACPHHGPDLKSDPSGNQHVVWFSNSKKRQGLFYANLQAEQNSFNEPLPFGNPKTASHPYLSSQGTNLYLVWTAYENDKMKLYLKQSPDSGKSWGEEKVIAESSGATDYAFLIKKDDGIFVSWHTRQQGLIIKKVN